MKRRIEGPDIILWGLMAASITSALVWELAPWLLPVSVEDSHSISLYR